MPLNAFRLYEIKKKIIAFLHFNTTFYVLNKIKHNEIWLNYYLYLFLS